MVKKIDEKVALSNGIMMPWFGMGLFLVKEKSELINAVKIAASKGCRLFDTAYAYCNEQIVGEALEQLDVVREELFITTKLWNSDHGYDQTLKAFDRSMASLKLDVLDLYLIHWPLPQIGRYADSWKAMVRLYNEKRVRAIGVSNFLEHHIERIVDETGFMPSVNQVERHPLLQQQKLAAYCKTNGIQMEAYSPLLNGRIEQIDDVLKPIAHKYNKTAAQIALRWQIDSGVVVITKAVRENHIAQNSDIFDFCLNEQDMEEIAALDKNMRFMGDPEKFDVVEDPNKS